MKTSRHSDTPVNDPVLITVLSLDTRWVARCPVRDLAWAQLARLVRSGNPRSFSTEPPSKNWSPTTLAILKDFAARRTAWGNPSWRKSSRNT